jgi:recombination protein RecA
VLSDEVLRQKASALTLAMKKLDQTFGKGTVHKLGERWPAGTDIRVISTGSICVDDALGVGGLPVGRIVEIYGPEASGKTSLALSVIAEAQRLGGKCTFVDVEHALDANYARTLGVNVDELYVAQPDSGEQALEITDTIVRSGAMSVVVVDSVAALVPQQELDGEMGSAPMGGQARLMGQALRKITPALAKADTILIFINQLRQKIGVVFGNPEVTSGGNSLKFYASVRLDVRRVDILKDGEQAIGTTHRVKVVKNKLAPPLATCQFGMFFGKGIDKLGGVIDLGVTRGVLEKKGAFYYVAASKDAASPALQLGQGRANAVKTLERDVELRLRIEAAVRAAPKPSFVPGVDEEEEGPAPGEQAAVQAAEGATLEEKHAGAA